MPLFFQRLREMGINTAMVYGDGDPGFVLDNHFPYYVENMVNRGFCLKWNSKVRDWDTFVTAWAQDRPPALGAGAGLLPGRSAVADWARAQRCRRSVPPTHRQHQPLAYNLRDELSDTFPPTRSITISAPPPWPDSASGLKSPIRDLAALNTEWETDLLVGTTCRPFTTDQIKNRMASGETRPRGKPDWQQLEALKFDAATARQSPTRWNFAPWADFRTYMDRSLAGCSGRSPPRGPRNWTRKRPSASRARRCQTPLAGMISGGFRARSIGWSLMILADAREIFGSFMPGTAHPDDRL